jgi:hypothetical protein
MWLGAFLVTCAIEIPLVLAFTRENGPPSRRALVALGAQLLTHPLVWFVFPGFAVLSPNAQFVAAELVAWLVEGAFYALMLRDLAPLRAFGIAGIANGLSFGLGLLGAHLLS